MFRLVRKDVAEIFFIQHAKSFSYSIGCMEHLGLSCENIHSPRVAENAGKWCLSVYKSLCRRAMMPTSR
jgi:formate-dependent nitrite reductase cytochrome c552 subunit